MFFFFSYLLARGWIKHLDSVERIRNLPVQKAHLSQEKLDWGFDICKYHGGYFYRMSAHDEIDGTQKYVVTCNDETKISLIEKVD
jgi:hypothetical protein